jgi:hypothetical protein
MPNYGKGSADDSTDTNYWILATDCQPSDYSKDKNNQGTTRKTSRAMIKHRFKHQGHLLSEIGPLPLSHEA